MSTRVEYRVTALSSDGKRSSTGVTEKEKLALQRYYIHESYGAKPILESRVVETIEHDWEEITNL
jgi:hypothetical protein